MLLFALAGSRDISVLYMGTFFHFVSKLANYGPFSALGVGFHCNECGSSWISTYMYVIDLISGVMVRMLASSAVDRDSSPGRIKPKTIILVFLDSLLSTQH